MPLTDIDLGPIDTVEVAVVFEGKKRVSFTRLDCWATLLIATRVGQ